MEYHFEPLSCHPGIFNHPQLFLFLEMYPRKMFQYMCKLLNLCHYNALVTVRNPQLAGHVRFYFANRWSYKAHTLTCAVGFTTQSKFAFLMFWQFQHTAVILVRLFINSYTNYLKALSVLLGNANCSVYLLMAQLTCLVKSVVRLRGWNEIV